NNGAKSSYTSLSNLNPIFEREGDIRYTENNIPVMLFVVYTVPILIGFSLPFCRFVSPA
ncbi:unnamed protein product, partial [Arabidopsis halleri]